MYANAFSKDAALEAERLFCEGTVELDVGRYPFRRVSMKVAGGGGTYRNDVRQSEVRFGRFGYQAVMIGFAFQAYRESISKGFCTDDTR